MKTLHAAVLLATAMSFSSVARAEIKKGDKFVELDATTAKVNINTKAEEGKQFIESLKLKHIFPVFLPDENSPALKAYDPDKMPSTFVIDPQGVVRLVEYGYNAGDEQTLAKTLTELTASK